MKHQTSGKKRISQRIFTMLIVLFLLSSNALQITHAQGDLPVEEYRGETITQQRAEKSAVIQEESFGIAWADPDGAHSVYDWPFRFDQMGLVMQSYQNYGSGTSGAYFHHGIDMVAPDGTAVYTRSGGQVVNVENYQPGNKLYWEVAILDAEGYVWQYHHIDQATIPQLIHSKFAEWKANPATGGYIPPNTRIGNIIYWPVVSLGYRFNHIHLNILAAGDVYLNGLEFHTPLADNQIPEIQQIGLLNGNTVISGNMASGNYGMYVRARDLMMSPVYYLPPHKTEFSIDGGEWVTVWEFHNFPGGFNDKAYVNDFFVPVYTKGDYNNRDFYIDLGFTTEGQRAFPSEPGAHSIEVCVWDYYNNHSCESFNWNVVTAIPDNGCGSGNGVTRTFQITEDLLVSDVNLGINLSHASRGQVRVTLQSPTDTTATTVIANSSDTYDNYDVWVDDGSNNPVNDGNNDDVAAPYFDRTVGPSSNGALDSFNGKAAYGEWTVFVCDNSGGTTGTVNLIELEVIGVDNNNTAPVANAAAIATLEDTPVEISLTGYDADDDPLTFFVSGGPFNGSLSGSAPNLTYTPDANYNGSDSFSFKVNDGAVDSEPASIQISIEPVNDRPVAQEQSYSMEMNSSIWIELAGMDVDNDPLSFEVLSGPTHGSLSGGPENLLYTAAPGYSGVDSFTYRASDGELDSEAASVYVTINPPGPVTVFFDDFETDLGWTRNPNGTDTATSGLWERAIPQQTDSSGPKQLGTTVSGRYDLSTGPLAGSSVGSYDIDGGKTSIQSPEITLPANRQLTLSFSYYLSHLTNSSSADYLRVSVIGNSTQLVFEELGAAENDDAVWEQFAADISQFAGQTVQIHIAAADAGTASLVEAAIDDVLIEGSVTNTPPVAQELSVSTTEDTSKLITLSGYDADGDPLTFFVVTQPSHGSLSGSAPNLTYIPAADFNGSDNFNFKVNDGSVDSNIATVTIAVTAVNDAPVANNQSVTTAEDTSRPVTLTGTDIDGDALTYTIVNQPTHGTLNGNAPNIIYVPAANYYGPDSFTFKANDGSLDSNIATITLTITPVNDAPVANSQSVTTAEDTTAAITLTGSDIEASPLTFSIVIQPAHGTLSGSTPNVTYTPAANYNGSDSFTFKANDGSLDSNVATVTLTITSVNDEPLANPQTVETYENTAVNITLTGSDVEGSELTFAVVSAPLHGTLTGSGALRVYTPETGYEGEDSFTFKVNDGEADSEPAAVSINVVRTNAAPTATPQNLTTNEDNALGVTLTGFDLDNDPLTFVVVSGPSHGALSGTLPNLTYTPYANYHGSDSFIFVVNDGVVDSPEATISITVFPVNDDPIANPQSVNVVEDTATNITLTATDVDGDSLTYTVETGPGHGSLSGEAPNLTYTPAPNYNGPDSLTFKVYDGTSHSEAALVSISVSAINDAPVALEQSITTAEDTAKAITLAGSDVDGDNLTFTVLTQPGHGSLSGSAPHLTYIPAANFNGADSFTFKVNDGLLNSNNATVNITVTAVNDAPVANGQTVSTSEDTAKGLTLSGSDVDGDALTFVVLTQPVHGTLSGTAPMLTYTPTANYNGSDSITFKVTDGTLDSDPAVVNITVEPVNDAPLAEGQSVITNENLAVAINLSGSDIDGDALTFTIVKLPLHGVLTGVAPNLIYTPTNYYAGYDSFSFYVNDGLVNSNSADVTIEILDENFLPLVYNQSLSTSEGTPLSITLNGMDPDGDNLVFVIKSQPEYGTLSGEAPALVYTPNPSFVGSDSFTFAAQDYEFESNLGLIEIEVLPSGPSTVFFDDFEADLGWTRNADGTDTATLGVWERADPEGVSYNGDKQLGTTVSGSYDLVTGPLAGSSAGSYDLDGGKTSMLSPAIQLPSGRDLMLSFSYYVAHYTNSSSADYLRVFVVGSETLNVFEELGGNENDNAEWAYFEADISRFAGQTIRLLIVAADDSTPSLFEAAVDDVLIVATTPNNPPVAEGQSYQMAEDGSLAITLIGSDPDGDTLTFVITDSPSHGTLGGQAPYLTYTPYANYNGSDSFAFVVNDGKLNSESAAITIDIAAVNDAPTALGQNLSTSVDVHVEITLTGTDVEGDALQFIVTSSPSHGTLTGLAPNLIYDPVDGFIGNDSFTFVVHDGLEGSAPATVSIQVNPAGPVTIFWDDFETNQGWVFNPFGSDTATSGFWERADPESVYYRGYKQLGATLSGSYDLVTGPLAGSSSGSYDLDGGVTSVRSPLITLPTGRELTLSLSYYFAHYSNSSTADYLRIKIVGSTTTTLFQELGARNNDDAIWETFSISLNNYAGQTVYLLIEAADAGSGSLVEAAIDDVLIIAE